VRATWAILALLTLSHVWFWASEFELELGLIVPMLLLLSTRWMPRESRVWLAVASALLSGLMMPAFFATIAVMAALTLGLRALRRPFEPPKDELANDALEEISADADHDWPSHTPAFGLATQPERLRMFVGSASALYLSAWTSTWNGGALPAHVWWLDLLLTAVMLGMVWGLHAPGALVPLALSYLHLGIQTGTLSLPRTRAQWGLTEVGFGFALLATAVLISWQSRSGRESEPPPGRARSERKIDYF